MQSKKGHPHDLPFSGYVQLRRLSWSKLWWRTTSFGLQRTLSTSSLCRLRCAAITITISVHCSLSWKRLLVLPWMQCLQVQRIASLPFFTVKPVSDIASPAVQHRILYNNIVSIFWNAFLSTLSHAPTIEPTSFMDSFQQYADTLPAPLHERAAEFVDSIYKTSLPLHERAAEFAQSLKLPLVCATGFPPVLMLSC